MLITRLDPAEVEWIDRFGSDAIAKQAPQHMGGPSGEINIEAAKQLLLHPRTAITATEHPSALALMPYLKRLGVDAAPDLQELNKEHAFCFLQLGLGISPGKDERIDRVDVSFDFASNGDVAVHSMAPETRRKVSMSGTLSGSLAVNERFHLREPDVSGAAKLQVGLDISWAIAKCEVVAIGAGSACARWVIEDGSMFPGDVRLGVILRYPQKRAQGSIRCSITGGCRINRGFFWWKRQTPLLIASNGPVEVRLPVQS